jgi:hypothetical protein
VTLSGDIGISFKSSQSVEMTLIQNAVQKTLMSDARTSQSSFSQAWMILYHKRAHVNVGKNARCTFGHCTVLLHFGLIAR